MQVLAQPRARRTDALATRVVVALATIGLAYHYSLRTLLRNIGVDTPLAYLGLVPFIALGLATALAPPAPSEPAIHDRQLDYIIGVPLLAVATVMVVALPAHLSTLFWQWRMDLLSLPFFVAGTISIMFGLRALWRVRVAVLFLVLAWPVPYVVLIDNWLNGFTTITANALRHVVRILHLASPIAGDGSLFAINHGAHTFTVSVASACSGVNGMVSFILVGTAFAALVEGHRVRKLLWLAGGLALIWILNLARILLIFWVGGRWGEHVALDALHPFIGLVAFNVGIISMILVMPKIGLRFRGAERLRMLTAKAVTRPAAVPNARVALAIVLLIGAVLAVANSGLRQYELVAGDLGEPRLVSFTDHPAPIAGWKTSYTTSFDWGRQFFGPSSTWKRYMYFPGAGPTALHSTAPVVADVISTTNLRSFSTYGLEACYRFHGYEIHNIHSVDLGGGVTGTAVSYYQPKTDHDWVTVYWHWAVQTPAGKRYERVVLMAGDIGRTQVEGRSSSPSLLRRIGLAIQDAARGHRGDGEVDRRLARAEGFLVVFAQNVVHDQGPAA